MLESFLAGFLTSLENPRDTGMRLVFEEGMAFWLWTWNLEIPIYIGEEVNKSWKVASLLPDLEAYFNRKPFEGVEQDPRGGSRRW
jgi:hypothetical protein